MDYGLKGKAVLVTGGSSGIGRAIALAFSAEGASVAICARRTSPMESTLREIRALGGDAEAISADLFNAEDCTRVIEETVSAFGRLDVLINNASTDVSRYPGTVEDATDEQLMERVLGKALGAIRCSRAALPHLRRAAGGRIICIGGTAARNTLRQDRGDGSTSINSGLGNAMMTNFAKHLSDQVAKDGILVNIVHPHHTITEPHRARIERNAKQAGVTSEEIEADMAARVPIGRLLEPEDIAPLVVFLASSQARGITGQAIAVDGGSLSQVVY
jgi:3-oxoacyl-[acyl-carrier protein] reductase